MKQVLMLIVISLIAVVLIGCGSTKQEIPDLDDIMNNTGPGNPSNPVAPIDTDITGGTVSLEGSLDCSGILVTSYYVANTDDKVFLDAVRTDVSGNYVLNIRSDSRNYIYFEKKGYLSYALYLDYGEDTIPGVMLHQHDVVPSAIKGNKDYFVNLSWNPSDGPYIVEGYNVYKYNSRRREYNKINPELVKGTSFVDENTSLGETNVYGISFVIGENETQLGTTVSYSTPGVQYCEINLDRSLSDIQKVVADDESNIYVLYKSNYFDSAIAKFDKDGLFVTSFNRTPYVEEWYSWGTSIETEFSSVYGMVATSDCLYVLEQYDARPSEDAKYQEDYLHVIKYAENGTVITSWNVSSTTENESYYYSTLFANDTHIYVYDAHFDKMFKYDYDGNIIYSWENVLKPTCYGPDSMSVNNMGEVYISNFTKAYVLSETKDIELLKDDGRTGDVFYSNEFNYVGYDEEVYIYDSIFNPITSWEHDNSGLDYDYATLGGDKNIYVPSYDRERIYRVDISLINL